MDSTGDEFDREIIDVNGTPKEVIDSLLYQVASSMQEFGKLASISMMYLIQTMINVVIFRSDRSFPTGYCNGFSAGDGFTNMITPTSPVLIGVLGVAKIPYEKWLKWVLASGKRFLFPPSV